MIEKSTIAVEGMTCNHCKMTVEKGISELKGVTLVKVNLDLNNAEVQFDPDKVTLADIKKKIIDLGYKT
jgi:copper chaperone